MIKRYQQFLNEKFNNLQYSDLYDIAKWGLLNDYDSSACWDDNDLEGAIKCAIEDFKTFLSKPYPLELGDIPTNPIIYRLIRLKNKSDLNKEHLGISWFSNPEQYKNDCFFDMLDYLVPFHNSEGDVYLLKGQTDISNIDIARTLWERSTQWCENEIVLIDDTKVKLLSCELAKSRFE